MVPAGPKALLDRELEQTLLHLLHLAPEGVGAMLCGSHATAVEVLVLQSGRW